MSERLKPLQSSLSLAAAAKIVDEALAIRAREGILDARAVAIGAVGVSGDASDKDECCAIAAIAAAGFGSEPAAPAADWRSAGL